MAEITETQTTQINNEANSDTKGNFHDNNRNYSNQNIDTPQANRKQKEKALKN